MMTGDDQYPEDNEHQAQDSPGAAGLFQLTNHGVIQCGELALPPRWFSPKHNTSSQAGVQLRCTCRYRLLP